MNDTILIPRVEEQNGAPAPEGTEAPIQTAVDVAFERVSDVSTLPHIALRVLEVARDPKAGAADLRAIVEGDPALSARVLRCINSAAYALRTTVTNLHQAISYLGFNQVRNLAITASVSDIFKQNEIIGTYRRTELWKHMVTVGICARMTASRQRLQNFEEAFLAGLLHDIGIVLEDQHCHDRFCEMMANINDTQPLIEIEHKYLGFDHTMLGERIAKVWRFPDAVCASIRYHHAPKLYHGEHIAILQCVELANWICTFKGITAVGRKNTKPPLDTMDAMGLGREDIKVLITDLDHEITMHQQLFEL